MKPKRSVISAAAALALAAAFPAHAVLERMGPIDKSPTVGGFPSWFQDKTGITMEFCDLKTQAELNGGWCVLIPPGPVVPEAFPDNFFPEHFYSRASNTLLDPGNGFKARLVIALEGAFVGNGAVIDGNQMTFQRLRVFIPRLPFDGDYRVITPYSDVTYLNQKVGDRIFDTTDVGLACINTFECTLNGPQGPFLLPSPVAGGPEVPPMPDLLTAPPGTDPFFDAAVAAAASPKVDPGTGKKYIADPGRIGPVTGSPLPNFIDSTGASRNHNTFRIEVRAPSPTHDGAVFYTVDGETNFGIAGRLMTGNVPGKVDDIRSTYKADATGTVTDLDVYAQASPTIQARIPTQPVQPAVTPVIAFYGQACGGALTVDPVTGATTVNPGPYTAPAGATAHPMAADGSDFWGQSSPGGLPPSHVCVEDSTSRNAAGQVVPAYYLQPVTDQVTISAAHFIGPQDGALTVNAVSSDPTAILTLAGFGPANPTTPGVSIGRGAGTGLELAGNAAQVVAVQAPPSKVQIVSSKGGASLREVDTAHGAAVLVGVPAAVNDAATMFEDCSPLPATICAAGQGLTLDLLANDTVLLNGVVKSLRDVVTQNLGTVVVTAQAPRLGMATVSADGFLTYVPNPNANGIDNVNYTVSVNGQVSNQAVASITITPVNDLPVAGNMTQGAVVGKTNLMNLISTATDPDGNADVKEAIITSWPPQLGAQPVPASGVISFVPTTTGNFTVNYQVRDTAGALSANTGAGTVTVIGAEAIAYTKSNFTRGNVGGNTSTRWTVSGTDTVRGFQTLSIVYADGTLRATGQACNGTAAIADCVIGTVVVDGLGNWLFDQVGTPGGPKDPTDTATWSSTPRNIRTFSSNPVLGGAQNIGIVIK